MDPVTIAVAAIAAGAAAGVTDTAKLAVTDAYAALKNLISGRYPGVDLTPVEDEPDSAANRDLLAGDLTTHGAGDDEELLTAALHLVDVVKETSPTGSSAIGVDLEQVEAAGLRITDIRSQSAGVRVRDGRFDGDIDIRNVRAGVDDPSHPA